MQNIPIPPNILKAPKQIKKQPVKISKFPSQNIMAVMPRVEPRTRVPMDKEMEIKRRELLVYDITRKRIMFSDVNENMRRVIVDWMFEVCNLFQIKNGLNMEIWFLAVEYLDIMLSSSPVPINKKNLQAVGVSCLVIAEKVIAVQVHDIDDYVDITNNSISKKIILKWEKVILDTLQWIVYLPTIYWFIGFFADQLQLPKDIVTQLMIYATEYGVTAIHFPEYMPFCLPSEIADACLRFAIMELFPEYQYNPFSKNHKNDECLRKICSIISTKRENIVGKYNKWLEKKFKRSFAPWNIQFDSCDKMTY